jgi:DNA-binding NtrC family response regulator
MSPSRRKLFVVDAQGGLVEQLHPLSDESIQLHQLTDPADLLRQRAATAGVLWHWAAPDPSTILDMLPHVRRRFAQFPIIVCGPVFRATHALEAIRRGASHDWRTPFGPENIERLRSVLTFDPLAAQLLVEERGTLFASAQMRELRQRVIKAARTTVPCFCLGRAARVRKFWRI